MGLGLMLWGVGFRLILVGFRHSSGRDKFRRGWCHGKMAERSTSLEGSLRAVACDCE